MLVLPVQKKNSCPTESNFIKKPTAKENSCWDLYNLSGVWKDINAPMHQNKSILHLSISKPLNKRVQTAVLEAATTTSFQKLLLGSQVSQGQTFQIFTTGISAGWMPFQLPNNSNQSNKGCPYCFSKKYSICRTLSRSVKTCCNNYSIFHSTHFI